MSKNSLILSNRVYCFSVYSYHKKSLVYTYDNFGGGGIDISYSLRSTIKRSAHEFLKQTSPDQMDIEPNLIVNLNCDQVEYLQWFFVYNNWDVGFMILVNNEFSSHIFQQMLEVIKESLEKKSL